MLNLKKSNMKNLIKIVAIAGLSFVFTACATTNGNNRDQYPNNRSNNGGIIYRTPDGGIFREGEIYRDKNGNVYKNGRIIRTGDIIGIPGVIDVKGVVLFPGNNPRNLPPGQAKKIYGGNATDYAPGQVKKGHKHNKNSDYDSHNNKSKKGKKNKGKGKK